ncbi:bidirectional sugar transporter SWEET7-like [Solanum tuberosum]|uniref:bidirectional sugar transporter SWEET7-like n=1 Tax=Solanum tuberosum TaxID=4113 RepID=UPI00073A03EF|nr:PREDICTED: bidirectional sugar transporter SWEET7-like [Solanum tuberosum]
MVIDREHAHVAFGLFGSINAFILLLSPLPTFIHMWKKKSVEKFSPFPYIVAFLNCGLWLLYGLPWIQQQGSLLIMTINRIGLAIDMVYLMLFVLYSKKEKRMKIFFIILSEIVFIGSLAILVITLVHCHKKRYTIVGTICMVANILMYASPLTIMTANVMGAMLGLAQLMLYATYYKYTGRQITERQTQGKLDLVEKTVSGAAQKASNEAALVFNLMFGRPIF